jgi:hypothetical protein
MRFTKIIANNIFLLLSIACFIFSLFHPCYGTGSEMPEQEQGLGLLLLGWMGLMMGAPGIVWLANPLLLSSWILNKKKNRLAIIFGIIAICCALYFFSIKEMVVDEAGHKSKITNYYLGYWFWVTSMILNLGNVLFLKYRLKR